MDKEKYLFSCTYSADSVTEVKVTKDGETIVLKPSRDYKIDGTRIKLVKSLKSFFKKTIKK